MGNVACCGSTMESIDEESINKLTNSETS